MTGVSNIWDHVRFHYYHGLEEICCFLRSRNKLETHPLKPTVNQPITKRSIRTYSVDLRTFFHFLFYEEYIEKDITKGFKIIKSETKLVLPLFDGEVQRIDHCFNLKTYTGLRNYCVVHLMLDEGLRSGDVVNLTTRSVNFDESYIIVLNGKGDKDRIVPLAKRLRQPLYKYLTFYRPHTSIMIFFSVPYIIRKNHLRWMRSSHFSVGSGRRQSSLVWNRTCSGTHLQHHLFWAVAILSPCDCILGIAAMTQPRIICILQIHMREWDQTYIS